MDNLRRDLELHHARLTDPLWFCAVCGANWPCLPNRALVALAEKDGIIAALRAGNAALVDILTNTVAINVHAYATGKAHPLGRFEDCPAEVCVEWRKALSDLSKAAKEHDAQQRAKGAAEERERLRAAFVDLERSPGWTWYQALALLSEGSAT